MRNETIERNVNNAIKALQTLMDENFKVVDENELAEWWKDKYFDLVSTIREHLHEAEALYDDMHATGLTFGTTEAEGYLRSATYLYNCVKDESTD